MRNLIAAALVTLMPLASLAAPPQTAVLDVQNMTCGLCPVTVKKSLEKVAGVSQAGSTSRRRRPPSRSMPTRPTQRHLARRRRMQASPRRCQEVITAAQNCSRC
jgi:cation transport ATPase